MKLKSRYTQPMEPNLPPALPPSSPSIRPISLIGPIGLITLSAAATVLALRLLAPPVVPLSPVAHADQPAVVRQSLADSHESLAYYLAASQEYLKQARALSQQLGSAQTDADKQKIVGLLNASLMMANNAVAYYPQSPEGFATRADLLDTVAAVDPSVKSQADHDRAVAGKLGKGTATGLSPADLVRTAPLEQATLLKNVAIALPGDKTITPVAASGVDNTSKGIVTLKAGQTSVTVSSPDVSADNLVYFKPESDPHSSILSLSTKDVTHHSFTLTLDSPLTTDLPISWWIVK